MMHAGDVSALRRQLEKERARADDAEHMLNILTEEISDNGIFLSRRFNLMPGTARMLALLQMRQPAFVHVDTLACAASPDFDRVSNPWSLVYKHVYHIRERLGREAITNGRESYRLEINLPETESKA